MEAEEISTGQITKVSVKRRLPKEALSRTSGKKDSQALIPAAGQEAGFACSSCPKSL